MVGILPHRTSADRLLRRWLAWTLLTSRASEVTSVRAALDHSYIAKYLAAGMSTWAASITDIGVIQVAQPRWTFLRTRRL